MPIRERIVYIDPLEISYYNLLLRYSQLQNTTIKFGNMAANYAEELITLRGCKRGKV
jgi:hypothetical protein